MEYLHKFSILHIYLYFYHVEFFNLKFKLLKISKLDSMTMSHCVEFSISTCLYNILVFCIDFVKTCMTISFGT